jgi:hypothetical protein
MTEQMNFELPIEILFELNTTEVGDEQPSFLEAYELLEETFEWEN